MTHPAANGEQIADRAQVARSASGGDTAYRPTSDRQARWLPLVRATFLVLSLAVLVEFVWLLPNYIPFIEYFCPYVCLFTRQTALAYAAQGVSVAAFAWATLVLTLLLAVISTILAAILFWRRSQEWMVQLVAYFLVANSVSFSVQVTSEAAVQLGTVPNTMALHIVLFLLLMAYGIGSYAVFLLFPSGRFVPGWSWLLLVFGVVSVGVGEVGSYVTVNPAAAGTSSTNALVNLIGNQYWLLYGGAIGCQIYRYLRVSTPVQRQQTKWVVFGFIASLLANQAFWILPVFIGQIYKPIFYVVYLLLLLFVPVTFFIAVQRYRLYEIDVIINRTLVYGSLSAILAAIYLGSILAIQSLLALFTRQAQQTQSPLAIVVSTLVIAALFNPLRHRLQQLIDRRFYRSKYNAEQALSAFVATVQSEVDLAALQHKLVEVIEETLQPSSTVLWLRSVPSPSLPEALPAPPSTRKSLSP